MTLPTGSRGGLVRRALLRRFRDAKTMQQLPPEAAPFTSGRIATIGETQVGAPPVNQRECRQWTQGIWSVTDSLHEGLDGVLGGAFLVDTTKGAFGGPILSEAIVYASDSTLRHLSADPPAECHTLRLSDGRTTWSARYQRTALSHPPSEQAVAYRLVDESGSNPTTWVALARHGAYLIEVRLVVLPLSDDLANQQVALEDAIRQAHALAVKTL
ncbi:hypothetical protein [Microbispora sp. H10670]|uniref:hypothetical protein n=1 Tax=Microbispora sp. H10670 TaxID=2729108 RepID=UPI0015FFF18B|nr:hypothetical protein [Microbispora sp. H10670]